jgi:WD40 repeat protein
MSIKPILGLPGAATIGSALDLPFGFAHVEFSLKGDYAVAVGESLSDFVVVRNLSRNPTLEYIFSSDSAIDRIALSPDGTFAASNSGNAIRLFSGLSTRPNLESVISSPAGNDSLTALAVSDSGELAASFFDGNKSSVFWSEKGGDFKLVATSGDVSAMAFLRGRSGIVIADRLLNEVALISDLSSNPSSVRLASEADGVSEPSAVELSNSGTKAVVANQSGAIVTIDLAGGASGQLSCGCRATTLRALRGDSVFALTEPSTDPVMLLDGADEVPRVVKVSN